MPFKSVAQSKFLYSHPEKIGGKAALKEWSADTDFASLPEHVTKKSKPKGLREADFRASKRK